MMEDNKMNGTKFKILFISLILFLIITLLLLTKINVWRGNSSIAFIIPFIPILGMCLWSFYLYWKQKKNKD